MQPVAQPSMVVVNASNAGTAPPVRQSPVQQQQSQAQQRLPSFASTQAQKGNASFSSVQYVQQSPTSSPSSSQQLPTSPVVQQQQPSPKISPFTSPVQQVRHSPVVQSPSSSSVTGYFTSPTTAAVSRNFVSTSPNSGKQQQQIVLTGYTPSQPQQPQYVQQMPNMSTLEKTAQQQLQMNAQSGAYFSVQKQ